MKTASILDEPDGTFRLEYDNSLGQKHSMRLEALTYEAALREAKTFLEIRADDCDAQGARWEIE